MMIVLECSSVECTIRPVLTKHGDSEQVVRDLRTQIVTKTHWTLVRLSNGHSFITRLGVHSRESNWLNFNI